MEQTDEEKKCFMLTYLAYKSYGTILCDRMKKNNQYVAKLSSNHQHLLNNYKINLKNIKKMAVENQMVLNNILGNITYLFENMNSDFTEAQEIQNANLTITYEEFTKITNVIKQIYREWSSNGFWERKATFQPVVDEILNYFPLDKCKPAEISILVPGSGLGRLAYEIAKIGYSCQGNEYSTYMLFASNFLLNQCNNTNEYKIYPWIDNFNNNMTVDDQCAGITFPDVNPTHLRLNTSQTFSMAAGDFTEIYEDAEWDCVATSFFIDCAANVITVLETIYKILKPGGVWVNIGPLKYHYSVIDDTDTVSLPYEDIKEIIQNIGFHFKKEQTGLKADYCQNPKSMLKSHYECVLFVCQKPK